MNVRAAPTSTAASGGLSCARRASLRSCAGTFQQAQRHVFRSSATTRPRARFALSRPRLIPSASTEASSESAEVTAEERSSAASRYSVSLSKPLGLILEENSNNVIYVAEIVAGGNADRSGLISAGDTLISTSGYVYTNSNEYTGNMVRSGEQLVTMNVKGEKFDTVMAAIGSHPGHIQVQLEFETKA